MVSQLGKGMTVVALLHAKRAEKMAHYGLLIRLLGLKGGHPLPQKGNVGGLTLFCITDNGQILSELLCNDCGCL